MSGPRILVVDDDRDYLDLMERRLRAAGYEEVELYEDPQPVQERFVAGPEVDLALIDVGLPGMDGRELLAWIKNQSAATECLMVTAMNDARTAIVCLRLGAYDYLVKPVAEEDLVFAVRRALERKRLLDVLAIERSRRPPPFEHPEAFAGILTASAALRKVLKEAELHAASDMPMLITGESGTGKELLARAIHRASPRRDKPFLPVNMAALSAELFESEFFGHVRGAFTGAEKDRPGHLRACEGGTLFLDEIGNLSPALQGKLLRVLQDGEFTPVGSSLPQRADVRFIAATNEDLESLIAGRRFRLDLYYRIRGSWLHLPPLRERREDIPLLAAHFLGELGVPPSEREPGPGVIEALTAHDFPGNVRELRSILQAAVNLSRGGRIALEHLPPELRSKRIPPVCFFRDGTPLRLADVEKHHILAVYERLNRNKVRTARALDIGLNTLRRKLRAYGES